ncbi:MAG: ATP-binding protein [Myxococcales bacterium]|nr:hypothetical protein [Myxococcales bacterium]
MPRVLVIGRFTEDLPAEWSSAKRIWDEARVFFGAHGLDESESHALATTASELVENAIKYGDWARAPHEPISVLLDASPRAATVEVESPAVDNPVLLRQLDDRIQWIRGFQSPFEAYVERLKQLASLGYADGVSGLGLIRIAYEARCLLDFYVTPSRQLAMSAVYQPDGFY